MEHFLIIWRGAGILVAVSVVAGVMAGLQFFPEPLAVGDAEFLLKVAAMCGVAFCANYLLFSMLMKGDHDLFFLPARWYSVLFLLGGLGLAGGYVYVTSDQERLSAYEGWVDRQEIDEVVRDLESLSLSSDEPHWEEDLPWDPLLIENHLWTDAKSGRRVRADLVELKSDLQTCVMLRHDGSTFEVPIKRFILSDQRRIFEAQEKRLR